MKKLVYLFFILVSFCNVCYAQSIKFIQVTDVHLTQDNSEYLKNFVIDVNKNFKNIDFVIFTGDNIDKANPQDLALFLDIIKQLKVRPYVLVGNHDLFRFREMSKENYMHQVRQQLGHYHSNKANYIFQRGKIVFIVMNGVKEVIPSPNGYYRQEELIWLDKKLTKYQNKKVVIFQHFPILDTNVRDHNLYSKEDYEKIIAKHDNVISIISGHYHKDIELKENDIYHIVTKNFSNNTYYKLIKIDKNNKIFTQLIDKSESY